jgi:hypothetical protein
MVMKELHEGHSRGHFATEMMQKKILDVGYWWLTMYKDVHEYCNLVMHVKEQKDWQFKVL